jgi:RNA polymerase sigma-70 factor (ECF subfamily)
MGDSIPSETSSPGDALLESERGEAVRRAIAELPVDLREALVLFEFEERSVNEAAEILGTTAKGVESRLYRARGQLRARLQRWLSGKP